MSTSNSKTEATPKIDVDEIIDVFKIDVNSTESMKVSGLKNTTRVYKVNRSELIDDLYIIDTPNGRDVACKPHIVGKALESACFEAALEAAKAINDLLSISKEETIVIEHILRAAPGYELHRAFKTLNPKNRLRQVWIRPRYTLPSYRDHDNHSRRLEVVHEDFREFPPNTDFTLIKPDTEATGASSEKAIREALEEAEKVGSRIEKVVLYGFISRDALELLKETAKENDFRLFAFAMEDVMELAYNKYDMTLYGLDFSYWEKFREPCRLSSIVPYEVLQDFLPDFVPGSDQPGDFSSRQSRLFDGNKWEIGIIFCHLTNSVRLIRALQSISRVEPWYHHDEIFDKRLRELQLTRVKYFTHSLLYPKETFSCIKGA